MKCSYKQAWILLRSGSLRFLKLLKQFHTSRHITELTESRSETFGRRNTQPCLNFSFSEKWQTISNQSVTQWVFRACFLCIHILFSGTSGWKRYSHVIFGNQSRSMFCFMVSLRRTLPRAYKYFEKGIMTSTARLDSTENSSPTQHQNLETSQLQDINLE